MMLKLPAVSALLDPSPAVQEAGAKRFERMQSPVGSGEARRRNETQAAVGVDLGHQGVVDVSNRLCVGGGQGPCLASPKPRRSQIGIELKGLVDIESGVKDSVAK